VYQDSGLPAALELSYSDANDQPYAYTSATGYTYTMTGFHCEIVYNEYNTQVDVTPPEDFVANATAQATNGTAEDTDSELVEMDVYTLSASDGSYDWEIDHPEYFTLEKQSEDSLTFYYFYSDRDLLSYTYTLMEDFSEEDAEDLADLSFAQLLLSYDVTNVERNDIVTTTVDGKSVSYAFLHYTMLADSEDEPDYEAFTVCAWVMAPNGKDLMWINMMELNGEGNGEELIPEHEITYSVEGIQCVTKS
jgi:hypothetical protein